jgi:hypothetical protein
MAVEVANQIAPVMTCTLFGNRFTVSFSLSQQNVFYSIRLPVRDTVELIAAVSEPLTVLSYCLDRIKLLKNCGTVYRQQHHHHARFHCKQRFTRRTKRIQVSVMARGTRHFITNKLPEFY